MWHLLLVGSREKQDSQTEAKNTYPLIDLGGCDAASPGKSVPTAPRPPQPSLRWFRYSGRTAAPQSLPSIPFQLLEDCPSLMQMSQLGGFDCRSRGGGRGSSKVTGLVESWIRRLKKKKKCLGCSAAGFCAVKWSVLYFSEWRSYSVCAVVV